MLPVTALLAFAGPALSVSLDGLASRRTFSLNQIAVNRTVRHPAYVVREAYWKYGFDIPEDVEQAVQQVETVNRAALPVGGQTTVIAKSIRNDLQYLIPVQVGKHSLMLDLDTGSSDLWVMSTLLEASQRANKPVARLYDPTGAEVLEGHKWQIRYGDKSTAGGKVYLDRVGIGELSVPKQAVEAATSMSASFTRGGSMDGLLGLGSGKLNTIKPKGQPTWFENIRPTLAQPVFTSALKRHAAGAFDFGFIDKKKYTGEIAWAPVKGTRGFWDFSITGFAVDGNSTMTPISATAIADTGSSLWYAPADLVNAYWAKVQGATYNSLQSGWTFPCSSKLPDIHLMLAGKKFTIAGPNMNYQNVGVSTCFGGLQRNTNMPFSIFGDVFLKSLYVIFEHKQGSTQRIGFAQAAN